MAKQETAGGGRSTSQRQPADKPKPAARRPRTTAAKPPQTDPKPRTGGKTSPGRQTAAKTPRPVSDPKSAAKKSRAAAKPAEKPPRARRTGERPIIARRPGLSKRAAEVLTAAGKTARDPAFWQAMAKKLPPWTDEVGALLLIVLGAVMLTALLNTTSEAALSINLRHLLRQLFGHGAYLVALGVAVGGVIALLPKFGITFHPGWVRTVAIEMAFGAFEAVLHLLANDPQARVLAQEGGGGGYLGWSLMALVSPLGHILSILLFTLLLLGGLILAFGIRVRHIEQGIVWVKSYLQGSITRLDAMSFEPVEPPGDAPYSRPSGQTPDWDAADLDGNPTDAPSSFSGDPQRPVRPSIVPRKEPPDPKRGRRPHKRTQQRCPAAQHAGERQRAGTRVSTSRNEARRVRVPGNIFGSGGRQRQRTRVSPASRIAAAH